MTARQQMIAFVTVFPIVLGCQSDTSNEPAPQLPSVLVVPDEASAILPATQREGEIGVTYMVQEDFPADLLLEKIRAALPTPEWRPLADDWLNPGTQSSHEKGWAKFEDGTRSPTTLVHQWLAQWQDSKGNVVFYALRYDSAATSEPLYRSVPDNSNLQVTAVWISTEVAEQVMSGPDSH